ncbi:MAG: PrsW family intramembrane metalloprotease [Bacteroidota bacterium]|nr:PrsW family intramembrane metalloprotease [Bacteroidota bacterium]MDP4195712.1 PrsW family intramembrane metalloprotease [Bacteroidota bacterium]
MFIFLSALAAVIPILSYLVLLWALDKYDREPARLIAYNFLWGAIGSVIFASIGSFILEKQIAVVFKANTELIGPLLVAPLVEESTKGIFLLFTISRKEFDNITDGLLYGAAVGLGFGMTENFLYFILYGTSVKSWIVLVLVRSMFSAVMHCISSGTLGAFLAISKFGRKSEHFILPAIGLSLAILIHFTWNFTVKETLTILPGVLFIIFVSLVFLTVFLFSIYNEKKVIISELSEETESDLFPKEHIEILVTHRRHQKGWIDEGIRKEYIKTLITLAFRKSQFKKTSGSRQLFYANEVENCRILIKALLSNTY